jgi:hypothetical protein
LIYTINHAPVRSVVVARGPAAERAHDETDSRLGVALQHPALRPVAGTASVRQLYAGRIGGRPRRGDIFYWSVIPQDKPLEPMPRPIVLEQAVRHKPWWARRRWRRPTSV